MRAGLYARVSTNGQETLNQLAPLRAFAAARGWEATEYVDHGVSGAKSNRPALDSLMLAARQRQVDVIVAVKLDRLGRNLHHLLGLALELEALGVGLVFTDQGLDSTTPSGRLMFSVLGACAQFERELIRERIKAGLERARAQGRHLGRPRLPTDEWRVRLLRSEGRTVRQIGSIMGVHYTRVARVLNAANPQVTEDLAPHPQV